MTWMGEIIGRLHDCNSTSKELADICGYSKPYVSMLLNRKKKAGKKTKNKLFEGLSKLESRNDDWFCT